MLSADDARRVKIEYAKELLPILKAQASLHEFVKQAWPILEPDTEFVDGFHIKAICEHLEAVTRGDIRNIIINVPPRMCKSTITSVMWPAWWFIQEPWKRFYCASHSHSIAIRDSLHCRRVIEHDWYQRNWGHVFQLTKNTEEKFETDRAGFRQCTSVGSSVTGSGGDVLIGDDLNDTTKVLSDTVRNKTISFYSTSFSSRLNDRKTGRRVIMMQRCHEMDITGYIIGQDKDNKWTKLILPYEYESKRKCKTIILPSTNGKKWEDPRTEEGQLIWPEKEGPDELKERKQDLGSPYNIAGQLAQRPSPDEGGIIKKEYFQFWKKPAPPKCVHIIQSWDTAFTDDDFKKNSYSACTTWGIFHDDMGIANLILLNLWRGRLLFPDLRKLAQNMYHDYRDDGTMEITADGKHVPDVVLVEAKASGMPLIQDLMRAGIPAFQFDPTPHGDKMQRVVMTTPILEGKRVWLPARPPGYTELRGFAQTLLDLCSGFPHLESRDIVDTMTQVILRLKEGGFLKHPKDRTLSTGKTTVSHGFYGYDTEM